MTGLGNKTVTVTAMGRGGDSNAVTITITVAAANEKPTLGSIGPRTVQVGNTLTIRLAGYDPNGDEITYEVTSGTVGELDPGTGVFTFTPTTDHVGDNNMTFRCTDGLLNSDPRSTRITVTAIPPPPVIPPKPPVLTAVGNKNITTAQTITVTLQSTNPKNQNLQYRRNTLSWQTSPTFTIRYTSAGTRLQTMRVRDEDGLTDTITFSVIVRTVVAPPPPVIQLPTSNNTVDTPAYYVGRHCWKW